MSLDLRGPEPPLIVVVGGGGVGKTTLAAALGLVSANAGNDTLVMTFDPSLRLKDTLGVGHAARDEEIEVPRSAAGAQALGASPARLCASLLDARKTFDRLVGRYAPDEASRERILSNRYYDYLAGHLGGVLEYMAIERLYEVSKSGRHARLILDTPPTAQAIDFLEAPRRIVDFLDSGALKIALRPWFDDQGGLRTARGLGFVGRSLEGFLDRIVGLDLLRDMSEFFRAFEPLFDGFRQRATEVEKLLRDPGTIFVLVTGPGSVRIPDTIFFARRLLEAGLRLGPIVVNRVHPRFPAATRREISSGGTLFHWLGENHRRGLDELRRLLPSEQILVEMPLEAQEPTDLGALQEMGERLASQLR